MARVALRAVRCVPGGKTAGGSSRSGGRGGPWPVFALAGARLVDFGADSVEVGSARFDRVASSGDARFTEAVPPTAPGSPFRSGPGTCWRLAPRICGAPVEHGAPRVVTAPRAPR